MVYASFQPVEKAEPECHLPYEERVGLFFHGLSILSSRLPAVIFACMWGGAVLRQIALSSHSGIAHMGWMTLFFLQLYFLIECLFSLKKPLFASLSLLFSAVLVEVSYVDAASSLIALGAFSASLVWHSLQEAIEEVQEDKTEKQEPIAREEAPPRPQKTLCEPQLDREKEDLKTALYATQEELAQAYHQLRALQEEKESYKTAYENSAVQNLPQCVESHAEQCNSCESTQEEAADAAEDQNTLYRGKYEQLKQQFREQRVILDETRKELFIVQGRELALSHKLREYDFLSSHMSFHEVLQALSSSCRSEALVTEDKDMPQVIRQYEELISALCHMIEQLEVKHLERHVPEEVLLS